MQQHSWGRLRARFEDRRVFAGVLTLQTLLMFAELAFLTYSIH